MNDKREIEIWSGTLSATRGAPRKGDRWIRAELIGVNSIGQAYAANVKEGDDSGYRFCMYVTHWRELQS